MGNEITNEKLRETNQRRSLPAKNIEGTASPIKASRFRTVDQSLEVPPPSAAPLRRQYRSIDLEPQPEDVKSIRSERRQMKEVERDNVLQKLGKKNQQLRLQLKKISDELTDRIKHKKFVPKKRVAGGGEEQGDRLEEKMQATAGLRRELENGYRQIEMYKRTLVSLKGKNEEHETDVRVHRLENLINSTDQEINVCAQKVEGVKRITKGQDRYIEKDINEDLKGGVVSLKKEAEEVKKVLKDYTRRDRQREVNYKKQQAYLFEVEKKYRESNGDYFPELKKKPNGGGYPPINSRVTKGNKNETSTSLGIDQYFATQQQLNRLKSLHQEYHRKVDAKVLLKNKMIEEQSSLDENIRYSEKVIQTLRMKLTEVKKITRPTRKSLFGYDNYSGTELQGQNDGGADEIEKEIQEQEYQDQFDIRHLIANIPKPARQKIVVEFQDDGKNSHGGNRPNREITRDVSREKNGMFVSGEKSEPKKWGSSQTRTEEKGRAIKKETAFDDSSHCPPDSKPLIIGINMWVNKNNAILGLQTIYLIGDEIRYGYKSSNAIDGFLQRYDLQSPDYLKNVTGAFNPDGYLEYLILYSKQGKVGTFGFKTDIQDTFNYGLSSSERPYRLFGASFLFDSEPRVNRLGLEISQQ